MTAPFTAGIPRDCRPTIKLILAGNTRVGKTCLVASYLKGSPDRRPPTTVAPAYNSQQVKRHDGSVIVLEIWDTAGQEEYASMSQLFFREAMVALICFDASEPNYSSGAKEWADRVLSEVPECHLFGVFTKSDKYSPEELKTAFEEAQLKLEGVRFEKFFMTSAITRDGVDTVFEAAAEVTAIWTSEEIPIAPPNGGRSCC
jgi:small GTP-binding protein